ncbi:hypothetical protein GLP23_11880 [Photobacterium carnosum]|nr:hypothetical protein [Photobacterium carnosum]
MQQQKEAQAASFFTPDIQQQHLNAFLNAEQYKEQATAEEQQAIKKNKRNDGKLNIQTSPALLQINPKTNSIKPLAYGFISQEELLSRFLNVATDYAPDF